MFDIWDSIVTTLQTKLPTAIVERSYTPLQDLEELDHTDPQLRVIVSLENLTVTPVGNNNAQTFSEDYIFAISLVYPLENNETAPTQRAAELDGLVTQSLSLSDYYRLRRQVAGTRPYFAQATNYSGGQVVDAEILRKLNIFVSVFALQVQAFKKLT